MEREQIIKALECCSDDNSCYTAGCPYKSDELTACTTKMSRDALSLITSQEQRIGAQDMTISELRKRVEKAKHDAYRYAQRIKELTEENERLRDKLERTDHALIIMGKAHNELFTKSFKIKSDTVRKMQERFIAELRKDGRMNYYIRKVLDQIAKEMLEG